MPVCGAPCESQLRAIIGSCCDVLSLYAWLTDACVLDFFTEELWRKLPNTWQDALHDVQPAELGCLLDQTLVPRYQRPWPLSLLSLRSAVHGLSLSRRKELSNGALNQSDCDSPFLEKKKSSCINDPELGICKHSLCNGDMQGGPVGGGCDSTQQSRLIRAFQKRVKLKKRHEIFRMSKVVCECAQMLGVGHVVDVGSGVGHLSRLLSYGHGLSVCCIEAQDSLSCVARKLDKEMENNLSKYLSKEQFKLLRKPCHLTYNIGSAIKKSDFIKLVCQAFLPESKDEGLKSSNITFGIVGLHPCGDLAASLIQLFLQCPGAHFLCIAGCCYMKLTPNIGYPLSEQSDRSTKNGWRSGFLLTYEAREMACHAIETYSQNLLSGNFHSLKIHCYRATLETIIAKNWPQYRRSGLKSIKCSEGLQFFDYATEALSTLNLVPPEEDLNSCRTTECLSLWKHVVVFYTLRLMLAPLVETLLLLDRHLFLSSKGVPCKITPEFDPEVSPRNHLMIAVKPSSSGPEH